MTAPTGVLLLTHGAARTMEDLPRYYTHIRRGSPPPEPLLRELTERYQAIGGASPLLEITDSVARRLQEALNQENGPSRYRVYTALKHTPPYIPAVVDQALHDGVANLLGIALTPHYNRFSIEGYRGPVAERLTELDNPVPFAMVSHWHLEPKFLKLLAKRIRDSLDTRFSDEERQRVKLYFSAHSLPQKIINAGDPYPDELKDSAARIAEMAGFSPTRYGMTWQSAGRTADPWLGPDILDTLRQEAANGTVAILDCPQGFVSDHLEVLYDLDIEARHLAASLGIHFERTMMPNDDPAFVDVLLDVVRHAEAR